MRLGIIYNTNAGNSRNNISQIIKLAEVVETSKPSEIYHALAKLNLCQRDILGVYGGDGTLHHTLTKCFELYGKKMPAILLLKGGTINATTDNFAVHYNTETAVKAVKEGKFSIHLKPILKIDNGSVEYAFIYGSGLAYKFVKEYHSGNHKGPLKVIKLIAKCLLDKKYLNSLLESTAAEVYTLGGLAFDSHNILLISTVKNIGLGFGAMAKAGEEGKAQLRGGMIKPEELINNLLKSYSGKISGIYDEVTDFVIIKPKGNLKYILDGEPKSSKNELKISTEKLKFVLPTN